MASFLFKSLLLKPKGRGILVDGIYLSVAEPVGFMGVNFEL